MHERNTRLNKQARVLRLRTTKDSSKGSGRKGERERHFFEGRHLFISKFDASISAVALPLIVRRPASVLI